jgi:hypothetical protein
VARSILRIILGSKPSTPTELIYAESGTEPTAARRDWLSPRYLISLSQNPTNLTYNPVKTLHDETELWPPRCFPSLKIVLPTIKPLGIKLFSLPAGVTDQSNKQPSPWASLPALLKWFPVPKNEAVTNHQVVVDLFDALLTNIQAPSTHIYTDGSVIKSPHLQLCCLHPRP